MTQLVSIRMVLNGANHDYKGHRAAAVHEVSHAIHQIKHGKAHPNAAKSFQAAKTGNNEPQNVSDMQLQNAMTSLKALTVPAVKNQAKVQAHISTAIAEIQTALTIK